MEVRDKVNSTIVWLNLPPQNINIGGFHLSRGVLKEYLI